MAADRENGASRRKPQRARQLGVTADDYARLLAAQGGGCAIRGCKVRAVKRRYHVDHDHRSGALRGLLCFRHNRLLLHSWVTADDLRACAEYLDAARD